MRLFPRSVSSPEQPPLMQIATRRTNRIDGRRLLLKWLLLLVGCVTANPLQAQVQRTIVNPSFEAPLVAPPATFTTQAAGTYNIVPETWVLGWQTTSPPAACTNPGSPCNNGIEEWYTPFLGITAADGTVSAELNASAVSMLYQTVCMNSGEVFKWQWDHHGRTGTDSAAFRLGIPATGLPAGSTAADSYSFPIAQGTTPANGTIGAVTNLDATHGTVNAAALVVNGWTQYSGTYTYTGASGPTHIGFVAISTATGDVTSGNELDAVQIALQPFLEFTSAASTGNAASPTSGVPVLIITGTVPAGGIPITLNVSGGTAVAGTDYQLGVGGDSRLTAVSSTATSVTFNLPAGTYASTGSNTFVIPMQVINATAAGGYPKTLAFTIASANTRYLLASNVTCGAAPITSTTLTINAAQLTVTKSAAPTTFVAGQTGTYTITVQNSGSAATIGNATLIDTLANGITLSSSSGTNWNACTGTITLNCVFTGSLAAGASTQLTLNVNVAGNATNANNTATANGGGDNSCSLASLPAHCAGSVMVPISSVANLSITKNDNKLIYVPGGTASYVIMVTNAGPSTATNAAIADTLPNGVTLSGPWTCAATTGSTCSAASGGVAAGSAVNLLATIVSGGSVTITVPVQFSTNAADY
jgi:uncharacterized repeat protein (TIGR01451 family)